MPLLTPLEVSRVVEIILPMVDLLNDDYEAKDYLLVHRVVRGVMMALSDDEVRSLEVLMLTGRDGEPYDQEGYTLIPWSGKEDAVVYMIEKYPLGIYLRRGKERILSALEEMGG